MLRIFSFTVKRYSEHFAGLANGRCKFNGSAFPRGALRITTPNPSKPHLVLNTGTTARFEFAVSYRANVT